jgi:hypothetical protein
MKTQQKNLNEMSTAELWAARDRLEKPDPLWHNLGMLVLVYGVLQTIVGCVVIAAGGGPVLAAVGAVASLGGGAVTRHAFRDHARRQKELRNVIDEIYQRPPAEGSGRLRLSPEHGNDSLPAQIGPQFDKAADSESGPVAGKPANSRKPDAGTPPPSLN